MHVGNLRYILPTSIGGSSLS